MSRFRFDGDYPLIYHALGQVDPGDVLDLDGAPDQHWTEVDEHGKPIEPAKAAPRKTTRKD